MYQGASHLEFIFPGPQSRKNLTRRPVLSACPFVHFLCN
ncbi:hypothetical protein EMIT0P260_120066 [Pseudomonas sp. IT-P260]